MKADQHSTLNSFYDAATAQDAEKLRSLLTDDFRFESTMMSFDNPEDYVAHLAGFCGSVSNARMITEGNRVVHLSTLHASFPSGTVDIPLCDVFTFDEGRISHQELFVDSRFFPSDQ